MVKKAHSYRRSVLKGITKQTTRKRKAQIQLVFPPPTLDQSMCEVGVTEMVAHRPVFTARLDSQVFRFFLFVN